MTIIVQGPPSFSAERSYVLSVILGEFLGLEWCYRSVSGGSVRVSVMDAPGVISLPDSFFSRATASWLSEGSMPSLPLSTWDVSELSVEVNVVSRRVPVLFGAADHVFVCKEDAIHLPLDIFGSAFFMLTRYEEYVGSERDEHERFPSWASVAARAGFLVRPIVDEYVEILWSAMKLLWPALKRRKREGRMLVSCDVDSALAFRDGARMALRRAAVELLKGRSASKALDTAQRYVRFALGSRHADPHWEGLQWLMDATEAEGLSMAFFFIPEVTDPRKDNPLPLEDPRTRDLLRQIHGRGHEIGLHPGYNTFRDSAAMRTSVQKLRRVMEEEGIRQDTLGGRQHYLRWDSAATPRLWEENGLDYDSTLGYADHVGFRCGTCHEYPFFDLKQREVLHLRERPLVVMECTVIAKRYMNLGYESEAVSTTLQLRDICAQFDGNFTLLWHNSHLEKPADRLLCSSLIKGFGGGS